MNSKKYCHITDNYMGGKLLLTFQMFPLNQVWRCVVGDSVSQQFWRTKWRGVNG